jgi:hypothetical protein
MTKPYWLLRVLVPEAFRPINSDSKSNVNVMLDWRSLGQHVLVSGTHLGPMTRFYYCQAVAFLLICAPSLTRSRVCTLQLLLDSPAQSFLGPSPSRLITIFYCPKFETPPTCRARFPYLYRPGTTRPNYTPGTGLCSEVSTKILIRLIA